jgi:chromate reductase, NAD(P)H dehydrogenase (quinone)
MKKYKIAIIIGSIRNDSSNLKLGKALAKFGHGKFDTHFVKISDLPLYNQDMDNHFPEEALRLKKEIQEADAILFVTPEYNRSFPGVLKNAIDWASRPYGKNAFAKKPAAICGTSPGAIGTACAQNHLKPILNYLDMVVLGQPEVYLQFKENLIDFDGNISDENTKKFLLGFVDQFLLWIEKHQ